MQHENQNKRTQKGSVSDDAELSDVWKELLNSSSAPTNPAEAGIPTLDSDPWSQLQHDSDIEVVDLQKVHLHMSDQDVERMLQVMQEQPEQKHKGNPGLKSGNQ